MKNFKKLMLAAMLTGATITSGYGMEASTSSNTGLEKFDANLATLTMPGVFDNVLSQMILADGPIDTPGKILNAIIKMTKLRKVNKVFKEKLNAQFIANVLRNVCADVDITNDECKTALLFAVLDNNKENVEILLHATSDCESSLGNLFTSILNMLFFSQINLNKLLELDKELVEMLFDSVTNIEFFINYIKELFSPNHHLEVLESILNNAVLYGSPKIVAKLLQTITDPNCINTALRSAIENNNKEIEKILILKKLSMKTQTETDTIPHVYKTSMLEQTEEIVTLPEQNLTEIEPEAHTPEQIEEIVTLPEQNLTENVKASVEIEPEANTPECIEETRSNHSSCKNLFFITLMAGLFSTGLFNYLPNLMQ